ncbi:MAG TPA: selenide, water dikinase SelD, partial [Acetobacteraceae bacterium]|nr:selenide, water dikinase SelD [Acetobacteraceae bacterium]
MQSRVPIETDILLLGAGHAHVEVLRRFAMRPEPGVRLTLVGREPATPYSGMLPGVIRGDYTPDQAHIDLAPLASAAGARLIVGEATAIDPARVLVTVAGRPDLPFDLLSVDVGGTPAVPDGTGIPVKPIGRFLERLARLEATLPPGARIGVIGGGPAGTELALALARRFTGRFRLVLVSETPEPLADAPAAARRAARAALVDADVELASGVAAIGQRDQRLLLSDGSFLEVAETLWASGVTGPGFLAASGLACDAAGCILVDRTLRSISHRRIFAAGDCAALRDDPRPKSGVWAVRAGAPLARNLRLAARGQPPRPWKPQRQALVLLGLGNGTAVGWRNGIAVRGRAVWRLKDWIDRRWMRMYAQLRMAPDPADPMRCGGCGAKVGAEVLAGALAGLPIADLPDVLVGLEDKDDAAVLRPPPGRLVVQSVDHFRAFLDDPFVFGQIAAAHALSDLHAMGAQPWTALAVAAVPYARGAKMRAELSAMLQGATEVLQAEGCALVGGHSAEAAEPGLGFAVTGLAEPGQLLRKAGLRIGDALLLTKPLGTGILLAGHMRGLTRSAWLLAAIASMRASNGPAVAILRTFGVTACTDVTGFGLAGHLTEMLRASRVAATLWPDAVPALPGALELAAQGVESTLAPDNRTALGGAGARLPLLADPQTSGGLLAGVPMARAEACLTALTEAGLQAAVIGVVEEARQGEPPIRIQDGGSTVG